MNKRHIGSSLKEAAKEWEKSPTYLFHLERAREKREVARLLRQTREREGLTQKNLAKLAGVTQSVISRIETPHSASLPGLNVFNKIMYAMGYKTVLGVQRLRGIARRERRRKRLVV